MVHIRTRWICSMCSLTYVLIHLKWQIFMKICIANELQSWLPWVLNTLNHWLRSTRSSDRETCCSVFRHPRLHETVHEKNQYIILLFYSTYIVLHLKEYCHTKLLEICISNEQIPVVMAVTSGWETRNILGLVIYSNMIDSSHTVCSHLILWTLAHEAVWASI